MKASNLVFEESDGSAALAATIVYNKRYQLRRVELHLSAAPTTSGNFTITRDAKRSTAYDNVIYKRDLSVGSVTDLVIPFGEGYEFDADEELDIAYANADARTWGLRYVVLLLED